MEHTDDWERHYGSHAEPLRRWLLLRVGQQADDCAQEVWARVVRALARKQFKGGNFRAWLFQIARNYLREVFRSPQSRRDQQTSSLQGRADDDTVQDIDPACVDVSPEERELQEQLYGCLDGLEEPKRAVMEVILSDAPYENVMTTYGWSQQEAYNQLRTAKQQLRRCLEGRS